MSSRKRTERCLHDSDESLLAQVKPLNEREFEDFKARLRSLETARRYRKRIKERRQQQQNELRDLKHEVERLKIIYAADTKHFGIGSVQELRDEMESLKKAAAEQLELVKEFRYVIGE